jgi:hypothetical protein
MIRDRGGIEGCNRLCTSFSHSYVSVSNCQSVDLVVSDIKSHLQYDIAETRFCTESNRLTYECKIPRTTTCTPPPSPARFP